MPGAPEGPSTPLGNGLSRRERVRKRSEYLAIQGRGRKLHTPNFVVFVHPSLAGKAARRLGVTVSRRVGKATVRNHIKRLVREVYRCRKPAFPDGCDVVFVAKHNASKLDHAAVEREIAELCARHFAKR